MDVALGVIIGVAVAIGPLEGLGRVQKLHTQLLAHVQQRHIEVIDLFLIHVGVVGVVFRDGRHRVHNDVGIGVACLDGLHQRGVVGNEILHRHAGVVGAEGHHHPAGLHHGHGLSDGVMAAVLLKGHDALVQCRLRADALFCAELLQ